MHSPFAYFVTKFKSWTLGFSLQVPNRFEPSSVMSVGRGDRLDLWLAALIAWIRFLAMSSSGQGSLEWSAVCAPADRVEWGVGTWWKLE